MARLTPLQFGLFRVLYRNLNRNVPLEVIHQAIWANPDLAPVSNSLGVLVHRLRPKIEPLGLRIENDWHRGYRMTDANPPSDMHDEWLTRILKEPA